MFVISGATGRTGADTASGLLEAGHDVRVLVRTDDSARLWTDRGAEAVIADFTDGPAMNSPSAISRSTPGMTFVSLKDL